MQQTGTQQYGITAVPTFLINGTTVLGALSFAEFAAIIDALLTPGRRPAWLAALRARDAATRKATLKGLPYGTLQCGRRARLQPCQRGRRACGR